MGLFWVISTPKKSETTCAFTTLCKYKNLFVFLPRNKVYNYKMQSVIHLLRSKELSLSFFVKKCVVVGRVKLMLKLLCFITLLCSIQFSLGEE